MVQDETLALLAKALSEQKDLLAGLHSLLGTSLMSSKIDQLPAFQDASQLTLRC
jgi:hypothetical protein